MALYLGIDGGGSKTTCVVADETVILGSATTGGSNMTRYGEARVREALHTAVKDACAQAKVDPAQIATTCLGLSGAGRPEVREGIAVIMRELLGGRITVVSDLETTLQAAFRDGPGVVTIAGTGSIAYGRDANGRTARAGGWGLAISDEGSGEWIGRAAVSAVLGAKDAGEEPALLASILKAWSLRSLDELVRHANGSPAPNFSILFPLVLQAAENPRPSQAWTGHPAGSGHALAVSVLERAGTELALLAKNVIRRLFRGGSVPVAMAGGVFRQSERVRQIFYNAVTQEFPRASVHPKVVEAVDGALALARKAASKG